ncbi:MAG: DNA mismatch repair endonuclease MutL [Candidatus Dadabacteria bacterium]|nr:DNA mismatch repair endonuclease MutL [Candidatus Dadabacteria bacterium]MYA48666.1 DNA mismatch repair endonuclease MutL [Candidatus Dadabacteria bacterium]MYG83339.1 DNA mismatch repair endonuclease MutL [Candidatus Dadabacteria bacterium]MYK48705.1 DNA mismatch repair endonuclease MutL [Candidatus Dadabacteria bacterium]
MAKIRTLPDVLVSKIAAGEIVERPASVVKELVENSIDAGATRISIHLQAGGKRLIRVVDNGHGMSRDDALMSIERHATSKIRDIDDLFSIGTLGFRGEALPSIASVSRFRMITGAEGSKSGTEIYIEGGVMRKVKESASPVGSSVEVKNLFFNTPPRLKFLKKPETELGKVLEAIQRESLSRPGVSFEVFSDGKNIHRYGASESLAQRVAQIIPGTSLYEIEFEDEVLALHGFLGSPLDPRSSMRRLFTYVNARPVRDRFINRIIMDCYGRMLEKGKYPQGVIFIERDPALVDVNVHPTKSEVMFENQYEVGQSIRRAISGMLADAPWMKGHGERTRKALEDYYKGQKDSGSSERRNYSAAASSAKRISTQVAYESELGSSSSHHGASAVFEKSPPLAKEDMFSDGFYSSLRFLGQVGKLYLVCENSDGIILVDQHAAHERVNFERIKRSYLEETSSCSQKLLIPEVIELTVREINTAQRFADEMGKLGFDFEIFGETAVRVKSVPGFLRDSDYSRVFSDLFDELDGFGDPRSLGEHLDTVCATMACHSSITANRMLSQEEAMALFTDMDASENPHACPHGRPVAARISYGMLEKMFKRT